MLCLFCACQNSPHLAFSLLLFRPSSSAPSLLFLHGPPDLSAVSDILSGVSLSQNRRCKRAPTMVTRSLATWPSPITSQVFEQRQSDKMITADDDATLINDPRPRKYLRLLENHHDNTGLFGVPTVCETSASQISRGDIYTTHGNEVNFMDPYKGIHGDENNIRHLLSHAHFLGTACTYFSMRAHAWLKDVKNVLCLFCACQNSPHLAFSLLLFRPSSSAPSLLFLHGPPDLSAVSDILSGVSLSQNRGVSALRQW